MNPAQHTSFVIERHFSAAPAEVFRAWSDPERKSSWARCHEDGDGGSRMDFRVGGHDRQHSRREDGGDQWVETVYLDIVPDRRLAFAYTIVLDGRCVSASLVTIELSPEGDRTLLRLTEQLAYLDGPNDREMRLHGTREGLDRLALLLEQGGRAH